VDTPSGAAFRLYRNYDGHGAHFGDTSLPCHSGASQVAVFAGRHSDTGEVDLVLVNEDATHRATINLNFGLASSRQAVPFQVAAGSSHIVQLPAMSIGDALALPPLSLTLLKLQAA
jgi:hypothetical protein